ncbi:hypothetical protein [Collinsella sp. An307]|uniref:hypothetical protein n=1 Tax=Collinsella sp. An307 TaxID=1965630 RepID=UPI000B389AE9|nr:hypothetical protein [Collinsella sp. An307]
MSQQALFLIIPRQEVLRKKTMQNRYTGDIGDFSKLGLLRALQAAGLSIGLNWYLTPDETHNTDGRHVDYLKQEKYRACDPGLWLGLKAIVDGENREVSYMEDDDILRASFFSDCLDFRGKKKAKRIDDRAEWFEKSLSKMASNDIVCVDPDNGLVVPSAKGRPKENKYVLPEELAAYYAQGSTVVYYQHKARRKDPFYTDQLEKLLRREDLTGASGLSLKFEKVSQRYYMFLIQPRHKEAVEKAVRDMLVTAWGDHFRLL